MVHLCHCDSLAEMPDAAEGLEGGDSLAAMQEAVHQLLVGVGEDPEREGLVDTPRRVAKAWLDMTRGYRQECKSAFGTALFHEPIVAAGSDGLVVVRDITFAALSEHSLLPFHGRCHIAYVPQQGVVLGLSKLARVTKCLAARLQTQQQFTERLVAAVQAEVQARGVAAVVQAVHLGAGPAPVAELSSAATGCFHQQGSGQLAEFLALLRLGGRAAPAAASFGGEQQVQQPSQQQQLEPAAAGRQGGGGEQQLPVASSSMVAAVNSLLLSVGEDPGRKGLKGGASRYASWLLSATAGYRMQLPGGCCSGAGGRSGASSPMAAELGPPTPDDHSAGDPSDASSDDMSAEGGVPFFLGMREVASRPAGPAAAAAGEAAADGPATDGPAAAAAAAGAGEGSSAAGLQTFTAHFSSQCEHHLLPFYGKLKLAYLPGPCCSPVACSTDGCGPNGSGCVAGSGCAAAAAGGGRGGAAAAACHRAELAQIVEMYARRLQVQERLTHQVADAVAAALGARAVLVVVESAHMCMVARGVEKHASTTLTTAARGAWVGDVEGRAAALEALLDSHPPASPRHALAR